MKKKILFTMMLTGGGHVAPAKAIEGALHRLYPDKYDTQVIEFFKEAGCEDIDKKIRDLWDFLLAHPIICKTGFYIEEVIAPLVRVWKYLYFKRTYKKVAEYLRKYKPDIIVSTHFFVSYVIDHVRRKEKIKLKLINIDTDPFDKHTHWILKGVDYFFTFSDEARDKMLKSGISRDILHVFDYPVNEKFFNIKLSRSEVSKKIGLDSKKKTLIATFGGQGIGGLDRFLDALIKEDLSLNVIIICGRNKDLEEHLANRYKDNKSNVNLVVLGFVDNMNELINTSDFGFIKSGAATTFEFLSLKKPVIFYVSGSISENGNIRYCIRNDIGMYAGNNVTKFINSVKKLMEDKKYKEYMSNFEKLDIKNGSGKMAEFIVSLIK